MSSGQKSKQRRVIQLRRHSTSAPRSKEKSIWTEGKTNSEKVSFPEFLLGRSSCLLCLAPQKEIKGK